MEFVPLRGPSRLKANLCIAGRLGEVVFVGVETASRDIAGKAKEGETRERVVPTELVEECTKLARNLHIKLLGSCLVLFFIFYFRTILSCATMQKLPVYSSLCPLSLLLTLHICHKS